MCKHFHRRYASKWFVWIGGTIYINIEKKKDESEFAPPLEFNIFKTSSGVLKESWYIFFINLSQLFACTQWQYKYMKPELIVQSKSVKKHAFSLIHFKWEISSATSNSTLTCGGCMIRSTGKKKQAFKKKYEWNKCTQRRRIK